MTIRFLFCRIIVHVEISRHKCDNQTATNKFFVFIYFVLLILEEAKKQNAQFAKEQEY